MIHHFDQKGFSAILMVLILSVISLIAFGFISDRTVGLAKAGNTYRGNQLKKQLALEAQIIFTNPAICMNLLSVSGSTFSLGNLAAAGSVYQGDLQIDSMEVLNPVLQPDGSTLADFVIKSHLKANPAQLLQSSDKVYYRYAGSNIDLCKWEVTPQSACVEAGISWDANQNRCLICEALGGTWGGTCVL